jgi:REP element-mobilizing transposase RayT
MRDLSNRRSVRLKEYDYSQPGAYFVTICTSDRECLFGQIENGQVVLSAAGEIAQSVWLGLPNRFPLVTLDEYVIMPNHVHGIILVGAQFIASDSKNGMSNRVYTLGDIVRTYKASVTRLVRVRGNSGVNRDTMNAGVMNHAPTGTARFGWQRNYYEHVIRNDDDLQRTREYIMGNPALWDKDENNPALLKPYR